MHPEILSITLFGIVAAFTPGPNNFVAFYSGFNFGILKTLYYIMIKEQITYDIFDKVDIRVGTVISVKKNEKARKPSLVVEVDFGNEIGIKQSSAQITHYYNEENLKGKQVIAVCNFAEKNIAGVVSQVLVLGAIDAEGKVTLVHPSQKAENLSLIHI